MLYRSAKGYVFRGQGHRSRSDSQHLGGGRTEPGGNCQGILDSSTGGVEAGSALAQALQSRHDTGRVPQVLGLWLDQDNGCPTLALRWLLSPGRCPRRKGGMQYRMRDPQVPSSRLGTPIMVEALARSEISGWSCRLPSVPPLPPTCRIKSSPQISGWRQEWGTRILGCA